MGNFRIHQLKDAWSELCDGTECDSCCIRDGFSLCFPMKNGFRGDSQKFSQCLLCKVVFFAEAHDVAGFEKRPVDLAV